jgi:hypothetical protein
MVQSIPKSRNHAIGLWSPQVRVAEVVPARTNRQVTHHCEEGGLLSQDGWEVIDCSHDGPGNTSIYQELTALC